MGKGKKIGLGIGVVFGILVVLGIISSAINQESVNIENANQDSVSNQENTTVPDDSSPSGSVNKSLTDILPQREDIGTEWKIGTVGIASPIHESYGNVTGLRQDFTKRETAETIIVVINAYAFNSSDLAVNHFENRKAQLIQEGGFQEYPTDGISANCYATYQKSSIQDRTTFYCVKENVYFATLAVGSLEFYDIEDEIRNFPNAMSNKIREPITVQ